MCPHYDKFIVSVLGMTSRWRVPFCVPVVIYYKWTSNSTEYSWRWAGHDVKNCIGPLHKKGVKTYSRWTTLIDTMNLENYTQRPCDVIVSNLHRAQKPPRYDFKALDLLEVISAHVNQAHSGSILVSGWHSYIVFVVFCWQIIVHIQSYRPW